MVTKHEATAHVKDPVLEYVMGAFSLYKPGELNAHGCTLEALQRVARFHSGDGPQHIECLLKVLEHCQRNGSALPSNLDISLFFDELKSLISMHYGRLEERTVQTYLRAAQVLKVCNVARKTESSLLGLALSNTFGPGSRLEEQVLEAQLDFNLREQRHEPHTVERLITLKKSKIPNVRTRLELAELKIIRRSMAYVQEAHEELTSLLPQLTGHREFCLAAELLGRACMILGLHEDAITWLNAAQATRHSASSYLAEAFFNAGNYEMASRIFSNLYRGEVMRRTEARR